MLNCRSTLSLSKRHKLAKLLSLNSFFLVFLTETWLDENISDSEIFLGSSYTIISRSDRPQGQHGGILIAVSNHCGSTLVDISLKQYPFSVGCCLSETELKLFILIYNPPSTSDYKVDVAQIIECIHAYQKTLVEKVGNPKWDFSTFVLGDFNFPDIDWDTMTSSNEKELSFLEAVNELCLSQFIDSPTHKAGNILDLILTDSSNLDCWVDLNLFSDHYPIYFSLECTNNEIPIVPSYSQSSFDKSIFNQSLSPLFDLICFMQPSTVFDFVSEWYSRLSSSLFISIRQKRKRRRNFPIYYSSHTIHLLNQKDTNIRKMSRFWSFQLALKQREIDLSLSQSIELDKLVFLDSFNSSSSTECFRMLRKLGFCNHIPSVMYYNDQKYCTDTDIANAFNKYLSSVFSSKVDFVAASETETVPSIFIDDLQVSLIEVETLLLKCDDSNSMGPDQVPSFVLHKASNILAPLVLELFTHILKNRTWPDVWKVSHITPLHKKGPKSSIDNYRPISILCKLSLILERIIFNFLYPKVLKLIHRKQHGFMKARSTVTQMISYLDLVYRAMDSNTPTLSIYFDVQKAFDSVPHHLLLSKLKLFGLCPGFIKLMESYLSNRFQIVKVRESLSSPVAVPSGVPQGSVLGPLLFILFINDMMESIEQGCPFAFADDLKVHFDCILQLMQSDLDALLHWSVLNGLSFHPSKCKCIPFSDVMPDLMLNLRPNELPFEKSIEDLGFTVTSNLDWTNHIETKLAKCTRVFNFMRRNIPFSTASPRKKLLYHSLVVSVLLYGSPVWSPSVTYLKKLEKFQMRAFKWICSDKSYKSALLSHSYLPLCFQLAENDLILLWKLQNRCLDVDHNLGTSTLNTRSSTLGLFDVPKTKKVGSESNFFVRSTRAANALISLKVLDFSMSLQHFKLVLRNFLLSKISNFDISNSCSLFIKCYCSFCRS